MFFPGFNHVVSEEMLANHALNSPSVKNVGGGVKVVEKWRFEIPKDSWHDFRWPSVFTPCPDARRTALGALVKKTKKEEGV